MKSKKIIWIFLSAGIILTWFGTFYSGAFALLFPEMLSLEHPFYGSIDSQGAGVFMLWINLLLTISVLNLNLRESIVGKE